MKKTKLFSVALLAAAWLAGGSALAWDEPAQDSDGVYQIGTASELEWFAEQVNAGSTDISAQLTTDITFNENENYAPIGNSSNPYKGTFDGGGHRIINRNVNTGSSNEAGFFGRLNGGAFIKNLILDSSCSFKGNHVIGAFAGAMTGGGTVVFENCVNEASVTATADNGASSAFVGASQGTAAAISLTNCVNTGNITCGASGRATAFCSYANVGSSSSFTNCYNTGSLSKLNANNQNFVQFSNGNPAITNCYELSGVANATQGFIRTSDIVETGELCYLLNGDQSTISFYQIAGTGKPMPFVIEGGQVYTHGQLYCDGSPAPGTMYDNVGPDGAVKLDHEYTNGVCSRDCDEHFQPAEQVDGVYQIANAGNLEWYAGFVNSCVDGDTEGNNAKLMSKAVLTADIDLTDITHLPIGASTTFKFDGEFDGQFHRIKNMIINSTEDSQAFFGYVRGNAIIKNLIIDKSCSITGGNRTAAIIGTLQTRADFKCKILNCVNEADVTSTSGVASGILGAGQDQYPYFEMHNCVNMGKITGASNNKAAAFCGYNSNSNNGNCQIWNCYNTGEITPRDGANTFFRGTYRNVENCYDSVNEGGQGTFITAEDIASGKLCYLLNQHSTNGVSFKQTIGVDPYPMPVEVGDEVYEVADYYCDGTPKGSVVYSNTDGGSTDAHVQGDNYICVNCNNYLFDGFEGYMAPEADGFYHLKTVDDVEWFSHMVRDKGHGAMNVKLDNDIDFGNVPDAHLPIGSSAHKFFGHFDGQGYRIKGMVLTEASRLENRGFDGNGFFGSVRGGGTDSNGTVNNEVIIENLIIDASCSVTHDNNFAAGVVAHINSRNDDNSNIIIRNCGNEANITSTGKNIAGILGCVEATNVGLKLYNLWNKGNVTDSAESAAVCAWTGQRNVDGEVDVEGIWNIGEVSGVDGNGYNLVRRNSNIVPRNMVDLCLTNPGNQGKVSVLNTDNPIESGELCYLLNGDQSSIVYYQTLGTDEMPVYRDDTHSQVYQAGTMDCTGAAVGGISYNNVSGETIVLPHNMNDETGICDICYAEFQEPALVDGWYELKNAGNVEWYANYVNAAGASHADAKLMNDIDLLGIENLHTPIGINTANKFNGTFDGQGFRIKNMIIERPTDSNVGFFGFLRGNAANTTIKNLIIDESCSIHAYNRVGGVAGSYQNGGMTITIENVLNEATITAEHQDAAGIIGGHEGGDPTMIIKNVMNTGTITAKNSAPYAGALCCYFGASGDSKIENFVNLGTVNGHNGGNIGRHNIGNVTNLIDLSDTADKTQGTDSGLTTDDIASGKLAYTVGWGQLLGTDEYPTPLNDVEVSYVGDAGYATLYAPATGYELNGDVTANTAVFNAGWLVLSEIENVPAGTPVVLKGTYYNKLAADLPAINVANDLLGTDVDTASDGTMYVLAEVDGEVGFFKATEGTTLAAGKAYYQSTSGVKVFYIDDDTETGIANVDANLNADANIYNLAGQRLQKMQKGINIINGIKILK